MQTMTIGVAIITYRDKHHLQFSIPPLVTSPLKPRVLVVNSSSHDGTVEEAQRLGAETLVIPRNEFNHGSTREKARRFLGTDIVVMMTPDAYPVDNFMLSKLVQPLLNGDAVCSYARQLPRPNADIFEAFPRHFNYPTQSNLRALSDAKRWGVYTFFCSNSCAAYLNSALDEVQGFKPTMTNEDYFACVNLLRRGYKVAYVAEAQVEHSHGYTLVQEFKRYFDTGYVRAENPLIQELVGQAESRGSDYIKTLLRQIKQDCWWLIPYAVINTFIKLLGYRTGFMCLKAPHWLKKKLSSQDFYWDSLEYRKKFAE